MTTEINKSVQPKVSCRQAVKHLETCQWRGRGCSATCKHSEQCALPCARPKFSGEDRHDPPLPLAHFALSKTVQHSNVSDNVQSKLLRLAIHIPNIAVQRSDSIDLMWCPITSLLGASCGNS